MTHDYARSADVVLRGYSGYNTRWVKDLMRRQPALFPPAQHVALVVILLGANDASRAEGHKTHYGVPIPEYKRNLRWGCPPVRRSSARL